MQLPNAFLDQIIEQLPNETTAFEHALKTDVPTSIRYNQLKNQLPSATDEQVKWHAQGVYLEKRPIFTLDPSFHAGAYYVQEASSMFVAAALKQSVDLSQPLTVLDLCAAPGGKSTLLLAQISPNSLLLSNEVIKSRYRILQENLRKWGAPNIAISNHDPKELATLENTFDVLLIDAPCSGEGLFRKDQKAITEWSPENVQLCSARQQRILKDAVPLLKDNGILIYCTCTYNNIENMHNVAWLQENHALKALPLQIPAEWGITEKEEASQLGYQFYPHKIKGEGFFISVLQKKTAIAQPTLIKRRKNTKTTFRSLTKLSKNKITILKTWIAQSENFTFFETPNESILALPKNLMATYLKLDQVLKRKQFGIPIGSFKRTDFIPSHELALSTIIHPALPAIEVDKQQALLFLKKEKMDIQPKQKGWHLIRYQGLNLGWIKAVPGRINNYLPKELRIRMELK